MQSIILSFNVIFCSGQTALHWAAKTDNQRLLLALLEARADPDLMDQSCYTALHFTILQHNTSCARMLLEAGANPNARQLTGRDIAAIFLLILDLFVETNLGII